MNTRCPPKRVPSASRFFTHSELTVQPPQSYSVGGQRSSGQLTGKPTGARPDYMGRCSAVSSGMLPTPSFGGLCLTSRNSSTRPVRDPFTISLFSPKLLDYSYCPKRRLCRAEPFYVFRSSGT
ncbi:UNVERIFIED_CONTAM: hypothetical protein FKN15_065038 [Acipenser sinensis]